MRELMTESHYYTGRILNDSHFIDRTHLGGRYGSEERLQCVITGHSIRYAS